MTDFISDGNAYETPLAAANEGYAAANQGVGAFGLATVGEGISAALGRAAARGSQAGSSAFDQAVAEAPYANMSLYGGFAPAPEPVETPIMAPEDYNRAYAPTGADGKQVSLGDKPMPQGLAQLIGQQKADAMRREGVIARFSAAHDLPVTLAAGALASLADPINLAATFIPPIGEESVAASLARAGITGIAGRTLARVGAGAVTGAATQVPLTALQMGLAPEEASEFSLADALHEIAYGAAGFAAMHAVGGAFGDVLRGAPPHASANEIPAGEISADNTLPDAAEARPILTADAGTNQAALSAATAQIAEGRPVDVAPFFYRPPQADTALGGGVPVPTTAADVPAFAAAQARLYRDGYAPGVPADDLAATQSEAYAPPAPAAAEPAGGPERISATGAAATPAPRNPAPAPEPAAPVQEPTAPAADRPVQEPTAPPPQPIAGAPPNRVQAFAPGDLTVDAKRFQFKEGGDEAGVTGRLAGVERWDPIKAGMAGVWEDENGTPFVVDGHQRHALASRIAAADPAQNPMLNAYVLRAADGVSERDARVAFAAKNIAEGTGTAVDAAKVLRERPDLARELPPRSELVRQAKGLANLDPDAFGMVVNDIVPAPYAAIVGRLVPDDAGLQSALLDLLHKTEPENAVQAEAVVRQGLAAGTHAETQGELFGTREIASSLYLDRAKILDRALKQLRRDRTVFSAVVNERDIVEQLGNVLAHDENLRRATTDAQAIQIIQTLAGRRGPVSDALGDAARAARDTGNYAGAARDFIATLRRQVESGDLTGTIDGGGSGALADRGEDAAVPEPPEPAGRVAPPAAAARAAAEAQEIIDRTAQGDQRVMPGMERSARQAQAARDAEGGGRLTAPGPQQEPGGLFAPREAEQPGLFDRDPEIAEAERQLAVSGGELNDEEAATETAMREAEAKAAAIDEAASCLGEAGL